MAIRGSGRGGEDQRVNNLFYRGTVVKNNDPAKLNRVKIYIPELTNQPYDEWFEKFENFNIKSPGTNSNPKTESEKLITGDWEDVEMFEEIAKLSNWAEPCYPIVGESGNYRYFKDGKVSIITDNNYGSIDVNDTEPPTLQTGAFSPAFLYENMDTAVGDAFSSPLDNFSVKCNPYSFSYRPSKHVNKAKGLFGIPEVGSKVWVFHNDGDLQFPVYFGVTQDYRSLTLLNDTDNESGIGSTYPNDYEN